MRVIFRFCFGTPAMQKQPQMDALDKYMFSEACHPAFDIALRIENYTGVTMKNKLTKGSSSSALVSEREFAAHTAHTTREACVL